KRGRHVPYHVVSDETGHHEHGEQEYDRRDCERFGRDRTDRDARRGDLKREFASVLGEPGRLVCELVRVHWVSPVFRPMREARGMASSTIGRVTIVGALRPITNAVVMMMSFLATVLAISSACFWRKASLISFA